MTDHTDLDDKNIKTPKWFWISCVLVLLIWIVTLIVGAQYPASDRGTFGDMFGGTNALFSGFAFLGVIYAISLQSKELALQRRELQLTRLEVEGQKKQLVAQNATIEQQRFENTFFEMMGILNSLLESIDLVSSDNKITKGRDCIGVYEKRFKKRWKRVQETEPNTDPTFIINKAYLLFFDTHESELGHYFRTLYNILKFVDGSAVAEKQVYSNFVRAQLSSVELNMIFYNCLSDMGNENFKPLIERYSMLKNMSLAELYLPEQQLVLYKPSAYGLKTEEEVLRWYKVYSGRKDARDGFK